MNVETASLQLPKDMIEACINQQVSIAMANAFADKDRIIRECVVAILNQKVDSSGKPSSGYSGDLPFVQYAVRDCLRKAVLSAITEQMAENSALIKSEIAKQLANSKSPMVKNLAESLVSGMAAAVAGSYRFTLEVKGDS